MQGGAREAVVGGASRRVELSGTMYSVSHCTCAAYNCEESEIARSSPSPSPLDVSARGAKTVVEAPCVVTSCGATSWGDLVGHRRDCCYR